MPIFPDNTKYEWIENTNSMDWDNYLASNGGHPLQSAQWGNARKSVDGIKDNRWIVMKDGKPIYQVRFEERRLFKVIKIAWIPNGPAICSPEQEENFQKDFLSRLKQKGYFLCVMNPRKKMEIEQANHLTEYTMWVDLTIGKEKLWSNLSKHFRNDVRRSKKKGIVVQTCQDEKSIEAFYELCRKVSYKKKFNLNTSIELMRQLLQNEISEIESNLFLAHYEGQLCAGAFIIRAGKNIHYFWGGIDRTYSKLSPSETLQWEIIEWALQKNCVLYDLEGIDVKSNSGTYEFKKKLCGEIIAMPGKQIYLLNSALCSISGILNFKKILRKNIILFSS